MGAQPSLWQATKRGSFSDLQPTELAQLLKRFPHADQARAAAGRIENHIRQPPAALLRQLQPHRFLPFQTVRFLQGGHVEPLHGLLTVPNDPAAIGDQAVHQEDFGSGEMRFHLINPGRVVGHEHVNFHAGAGPVGCQRTAGIAGRGNGEPLQTELLCQAHGYGHAATLERAGRQLRFVLDGQARNLQSVAETRAGEKRRQAFAQA